MSSLPHSVPSRTAHAIAALYGHEDDTLIVWQRACVQAAEALRPPHDPERLSKALALAQGGHVALDDDGYALVSSGTKRYQVQADGVCDCPDAQHRGAPCKHVLAVLIHVQAQRLLDPSAAAPPAPAATTLPPPASTKPTRPAKPRHSAAWDVHEAPFSSCFKIRLGALEWTHTIRARAAAEGQARLHAFLPTFRDIAAALEALHAERDAAKAAPVPPPPAPATPAAALPQADLQALAAANGQAPGTPSPAAPSHGPAPSGAAPDDQQTGFCSIHQVQMTLRGESPDTWHSHWLEDEQRYCKGARPNRRNDKSRR